MLLAISADTVQQPASRPVGTLSLPQSGPFMLAGDEKISAPASKDLSRTRVS
jgi:hypothetical protein